VLITAAGDRTSLRFLEFFAGQIRNPHTRCAYSRVVEDFLAWCANAGVLQVAAVQSLHVATWIESQTRELAAPSVKQQLAALRHLFDWLVTGQVIPVNPASSVRGPSHIVKQGKTPVLEPAEARALLDSLDTTTPAGLRDRALIGLMVYSFARVGAALAMTVTDVYVQNRRLWVRLREKGGKAHAMPCHHNLEEYLTAYLDGAGLRDDPKGPLFRTIGRGTGQLTRTPLTGKASWFLPFNKGWNDGAGNPPNLGGLKTDYLWKDILTPLGLTNIIENYAQIVERRDPKTGKVKRDQLFPRFHQLDVVRELLADAQAKGVGRRVLIQHSAGSGKSNSIAWLAHQLVRLGNDSGQIFDSVIVVTDRRILDQQIRDTI
jgi:site-specific recombinase XerC